MHVYETAEAVQREGSDDGGRPDSLWQARYCDLLLSLGREAEVWLRAKAMFDQRNPLDSVLTIALDHLYLGRSALALGELATAGGALAAATAGLRRAGYVDELPHGLLARANYHLAVGDFSSCEANLTEAHSLSVRCGMRLVEADACLGFGRLAMARRDRDLATNYARRAAQLVSQCGYGLRIREVTRLQGALSRF